MIEFTAAERRRLEEIGVDADRLEQCHARPAWVDEAMAARCSTCNQLLTLQMGIVNHGPEGASKLYCGECSPTKDRGYTLSDLQRMREKLGVLRTQREVDLMDQLGADVYFQIKGMPS